MEKFQRNTATDLQTAGLSLEQVFQMQRLRQRLDGEIPAHPEPVYSVHLTEIEREFPLPRKLGSLLQTIALIGLVGKDQAKSLLTQSYQEDPEGYNVKPLLAQQVIKKVDSGMHWQTVFAKVNLQISQTLQLPLENVHMINGGYIQLVGDEMIQKLEDRFGLPLGNETEGVFIPHNTPHLY